MSLINLAVVGSGMFGGEVAKIATELDIPGIVLNASDKDIKMLGDLEGLSSFVVGDGKGTGKSRDTAKEFLLEHISVVEEPKINEIISEADVVVVAGAAGGGFGSGTVPALVDIFRSMYEDKLVIPMTVMSGLDETHTAQKHTEQFLKEIFEMNVPYIIYDNENYKELPPDEVHAEVEKCIKRDLSILRGDYVLDAVGGTNIDERDLLTALSQPGRIVCDSIIPLNMDNLVDDSVVKTVKAHIENSAHAMLENDKIITASATMYNLPEEMLEKYAPTIKSDMQSIFGEHITDYRNESIFNGIGEQYIATILVGLSAPNERIDKTITRRQKIENIVNSRKASVSKLNTVKESTLGLQAKSFGSSGKKSAPKLSEEVLNKLRSK